MLSAYLSALRPFDEFSARRRLMQDGAIMPDDEIVRRHEWAERCIDDIRWVRNTVQHRDGGEIKCRELRKYVEWLRGN